MNQSRCKLAAVNTAKRSIQCTDLHNRVYFTNHLAILLYEDRRCFAIAMEYLSFLSGLRSRRVLRSIC